MISALRSFVPVARALVLRPLMREKVRSALTITGIAVGVAVLVAIQLSNSSALRAFSESVDAIAGRANYQIVSEAAPLDEAVLLKLQPLWLLGGRFAPVIDVDGYMDPSEVPIRILGVDLLSDLHFRDYRYARVLTSAGTNAEIGTYLDLFRKDSIILPEPFAAEYGLKLGDRLALKVLDRRPVFVIRGLLRAEGPATAFNGSLGIVDIATAQSALGMEGKLSRIDLMSPEGATKRALSLVAKSLPPGARVERPSRRNERVGKMLRAFRVNLSALAAVALLVGVFLVYNTVLISILRRRTDVGIVKTVGASPGQVFVAFLLEGAVFGVIGSVLGIGVGYILAWGTLDLIGRTINSLYVATAPQEVALSGGLVVFAILLGTIVSVLSASQPAAEAAGIRPSILIRAGSHQPLTRTRTGRLAIASAVLFVLAAGASQLPPVGGIAVAGYLAVVLVVAGFSLLAPFAVGATSRASTRPFEWLAGVTGKLAAASLPRSLRRVSVACAALSIAIGMMVAVAMMVGSFRETVRIWVAQTVRSDLWLRPAHGLSNAPVAVFPDAISEDLRRIDFIEAFDRFRGKDMVYGESIVSVGSGDFGAAIGNASLPMVRPRSAEKAMREAIARDGVVVSESFSIKFEKGPGDTIELPTVAGVMRFPITGVYRDYSNDRGVIVMDRALWERVFRDTSINTIAIFLKKGVDPERARVELERRLGKKYGAFGFTNATIRGEVMRIFDQTFLITYALLGVALIVAVLGIVNTLSAFILERSREIALLRVLGMTQRQIRGMIVLESSLLGIASTLLGVATGAVLSWILINVINRQSFGWTIGIFPPWGLIALSLLVTFAVTITAGLVPAQLANRIHLSGALKTE